MNLLLCLPRFGHVLSLLLFADLLLQQTRLQLLAVLLADRLGATDFWKDME